MLIDNSKTMDKQGGKQYGQIMQAQENYLDGINAEFIEEYESDEKFRDQLDEVEDLPATLNEYKAMFIKTDLDASGTIDCMKLKKLLESLGIAKTHLEIVKMIKEVSKNDEDSFSYRDFIEMMIRKRTSVLKLILLFEAKMKGKDQDKKGPAPKKSLADLP